MNVVYCVLTSQTHTDDGTHYAFLPLMIFFLCAVDFKFYLIVTVGAVDEREQKNRITLTKQ